MSVSGPIKRELWKERKDTFITAITEKLSAYYYGELEWLQGHKQLKKLMKINRKVRLAKMKAISSGISGGAKLLSGILPKLTIKGGSIGGGVASIADVVIEPQLFKDMSDSINELMKNLAEYKGTKGERIFLKRMFKAMRVLQLLKMAGVKKDTILHPKTMAKYIAKHLYFRFALLIMSLPNHLGSDQLLVFVDILFKTFERRLDYVQIHVSSPVSIHFAAMVPEFSNYGFLVLDRKEFQKRKRLKTYYICQTLDFILSNSDRIKISQTFSGTVRMVRYEAKGNIRLLRSFTDKETPVPLLFQDFDRSFIIPINKFKKEGVIDSKTLVEEYHLPHIDNIDEFLKDILKISKEVRKERSEELQKSDERLLDVFTPKVPKEFDGDPAMESDDDDDTAEILEGKLKRARYWGYFHKSKVLKAEYREKNLLRKLDIQYRKII